MKKNFMFVLAIVAMSFVASAAKAELIELTPRQMKMAFCQSGLDFQVVSYYDTWSGYQTNIVPAKIERRPDTYTEPVVVQEGTDLAQVFPVRSTVYHHVASYTEERTWTITETTAAGTSTYGPSKIIRFPGSGIYTQPR